MGNGPTRGIRSTVRKQKRIEAQNDKKSKTPIRIKDHPLFKKIKPKSKLQFRSDYFQIDDAFASLLTIFHRPGADDNLGYFWGIQFIPRGIDDDVTVRLIQHVGRMSDSWVEQHQSRAEGLYENQKNETKSTGSFTSRRKLSKTEHQLVDIATDLMNGASYLRVAFRILVKAPTLPKLDKAINKINRQYKDRFDTVYAAAYTGEQKRELSSLLHRVENKAGRNFMFTSSEFAGCYNLVTRGIEDPAGEYVGQMQEDVNNSAVLLDVDRYESHVVIAGRAPAQTLSGLEEGWDFNGERGVDMWGAKLGMAALLRNRRVVHLVLNRSKVASIGRDLSDITSNIDMTNGDINPFEMFGSRENALSIFPAHLNKLYLMLEQLHPIPEIQRAYIKGELNKSLNDFYVDKRMWSRNAQENRARLRIVGIPHRQVPRIPDFQLYLDMEYEKQVKATNKDPNVLDAYGFLRSAFRDMLDSNGDLFNTTTSETIDQAAVSSRVIYDFSSLIMRSKGLMMAQFVNALGFAVGNLSQGDVVILHGAEYLVPEIKQYVKEQFNQLNDHRVRVVYIYSSVDNVIKDREFNQFESADYTLFSGMSKSTIAAYEDTLKQDVPIALKQALETRESYVYYLRRGFDNIVFANDIQMGFDK